MPAKRVTTKASKKARRPTRRANRRGKKLITNKIPAAFATKMPKPGFRRKFSRSNEQEVIIEGEDLVIPTPNAIPVGTESSDVFLTITANPLYWIGTRISGIANVYQQFRPLKFEVDYIPQVPVTTPGQVIMGTLWNNGSPSQALQQTLMSSNGGKMTQCYKPTKSLVICNKKTLPLNLYNVHDDIALNTTNPFVWVAHYSGAWTGQTTPNTSQPGWIFVRWKFLFSVGLGNRGFNVKVFNELTQEEAAKANALPGWGILLGYLKTYGIPILRKIGIVLVKEAVALLTQVANDKNPPTVRLPVGSTYSVSPNDILKDQIKLRGSDGIEYFVSDSTRACVYMEGDQVDLEEQQEPVPEILEIEQLDTNNTVVSQPHTYYADVVYNDGGDEIIRAKLRIYNATEDKGLNINMDFSHEYGYYSVTKISASTSIILIAPGGGKIDISSPASNIAIIQDEGRIRAGKLAVWLESLPGIPTTRTDSTAKVNVFELNDEQQKHLKQTAYKARLMAKLHAMEEEDAPDDGKTIYLDNPMLDEQQQLDERIAIDKQQQVKIDKTKPRSVKIQTNNDEMVPEITVGNPNFPGLPVKTPKFQYTKEEQEKWPEGFNFNYQ